MKWNATAYITADHRGHGAYTFTAAIADIDHEHAADHRAIRAKWDTSGLTPRALLAWERLVAAMAEGQVALAA